MPQVEIFEKERATNYDNFVETWIPNYHYFLDRLPKLLREVKDKDLLVVGCGTGNEIKRIVKADKTWTIIGVDPSPDMIKQAGEKLSAFENVTLIECLVSDLDINKKYSAATLLLVLHFLDDNGNKLNLLKDIADRLKPGAPFVMLDITGDKEHIEQNLQILRSFLPDGIDEDKVNERLKRIQNDLIPISEERLIQLCTEAGFEKPVRFFQSAIYMGWMMRKK